MKLGDVISSIATPVARAIGADCIDPETRDLRPDSPCGRARSQLNAGIPIWDVFYDRFFSSNQKEKGNKMQFIITIAVEAESVEEALQKKNEGKTLSVSPRPQPPPVRPLGIGTPAPK
jgi:hypothetical protein